MAKRGRPKVYYTPAQVKKRKAAWAKKHNDKYRERDKARRHVNKAKLYAEQKGLCAVCHEALSTDLSKTCEDHNHETGQPRGLIHNRCNVLVGYIETGHNIKDKKMVNLILVYIDLWK
jgi:hypothetical protein